MTLGHALVILGIVFWMMVMAIGFVVLWYRAFEKASRKDHEHWLKQPP
jgi:hypothetical protein